MYFIILPTQLFDIKWIRKVPDYQSRTFLLWNHPHYYTAYKYNKKKIMLHAGSMDYYESYLRSHRLRVKRVDRVIKSTRKKSLMFDPIDDTTALRRDLRGITRIDSPGFMLTQALCDEHRMKTDKFFFHGFNNWSQKRLGLPAMKSTDKFNRNRYGANAPPIPRIPSNSSDAKWIKRGKIMADSRRFSAHYGNTDNFTYPLTHKTAKLFLRNFIKQRLQHFAHYQDSIVVLDTNEPTVVFHSFLSAAINIGLLTPREVIDEVLRVYKRAGTAHNSLHNSLHNSVEAFIRQLMWREYQRYCYIYRNDVSPPLFNNNFFGNTKSLNRSWYTGDTGMPIVDDCIKHAFNTGYLHHILRLMVVGNFMNLSGIKPSAGYQWFMEFACDSYEWVMHQNVLDMVFFVSGGRTMTKPYISSSNYIRKMLPTHSMSKDNTLWKKWDKLYKAFRSKHRHKLKRFRR